MNNSEIDNENSEMKRSLSDELTAITTQSAKSHCQSKTNRPFSYLQEGQKVLVSGQNIIRKFRSSLSNISKYALSDTELAEEETQNSSYTEESTSKPVSRSGFENKVSALKNTVKSFCSKITENRNNFSSLEQIVETITTTSESISSNGLVTSMKKSTTQAFQKIKNIPKRKTRCETLFCDGSGNIVDGRSYHYETKFCPGTRTNTEIEIINQPEQVLNVSIQENNQDIIDTTNEQSISITGSTVELDGLSNGREIVETFQILQSVTLEIPMKVNNDHQRETQYKKLMVYVIDKLNYFKQLNQGQLYEGNSLTLIPSQTEMNFNLLTSAFDEHFKRFENNNADLLKYIQISRNYYDMIETKSIENDRLKKEREEMQQNLSLYNEKNEANVNQYLFLIQQIKTFVYKWHQVSNSTEIEMYDENRNSQGEFINDFMAAIKNYEIILNENRNLKDKCLELENRIKRQDIDYANAISHYEDLKSDLDTQNKSKDLNHFDKDEQIKSLQYRLNDLKRLNNEFEEINKSDSTTIDATRTENQSLKTSLIELKKSIETKEKIINEKDALIENFRYDLTNLTEQVKAKSNTVNELSTENKKMILKIESIEKELKQANIQTIKLKEKIVLLGSDIANSKNNNLNWDEESNQIKQLREENQKLKEENFEQKTDTNIKEIKISELSNLVELLNEEAMSNNQPKIQKIKKLEEEKLSLEAKITDIENSLKLANYELNECKKNRANECIKVVSNHNLLDNFIDTSSKIEISFATQNNLDQSSLTIKGKKNKKAFNLKRLTKNTKRCTFQNCDGSGNTRIGYKTHTTVDYCPLAAKSPSKQLEKENETETQLVLASIEISNLKDKLSEKSIEWNQKTEELNTEKVNNQKIQLEINNLNAEKSHQTILNQNTIQNLQAQLSIAQAQNDNLEREKLTEIKKLEDENVVLSSQIISLEKKFNDDKIKFENDIIVTSSSFIVSDKHCETVKTGNDYFILPSKNVFNRGLKDESKSKEEKKRSNKCSFPNCDGNGNTRDNFNTHTSVKYCPLLARSKKTRSESQLNTASNVKNPKENVEIDTSKESQIESISTEKNNEIHQSQIKDSKLQEQLNTILNENNDLKLQTRTLNENIKNIEIQLTKEKEDSKSLLARVNKVLAEKSSLIQKNERDQEQFDLNSNKLSENLKSIESKLSNEKESNLNIQLQLNLVSDENNILKEKLKKIESSLFKEQTKTTSIQAQLNNIEEENSSLNEQLHIEQNQSISNSNKTKEDLKQVELQLKAEKERLNQKVKENTVLKENLSKIEREKKENNDLVESSLVIINGDIISQKEKNFLIHQRENHQISMEMDERHQETIDYSLNIAKINSTMKNIHDIQNSVFNNKIIKIFKELNCEHEIEKLSLFKKINNLQDVVSCISQRSSQEKLERGIVNDQLKNFKLLSQQTLNDMQTKLDSQTQFTNGLKNELELSKITILELQNQISLYQSQTRDIQRANILSQQTINNLKKQIAITVLNDTDKNNNINLSSFNNNNNFTDLNNNNNFTGFNSINNNNNQNFTGFNSNNKNGNSLTCLNKTPVSSIRSTDKHIGFFESKGLANGKPVFLGPREGVYYINASFNVCYLNAAQKQFSIRYI